MEEQLWYKWAEACTNYFQGVAVLKEQRVTDAGTFFQKAAQFSSSMQARENALFYYKDMIYLFGEERSFINDYLAYLKKYTNDKEEIFRVLKNESLVNPLKKKSLEMFYKEKFPNGKSFDSVWLDAVDSIGRIAPDFVLTTIRGQTFSLSSQKGKWVFIDFWGTWCGPCREEHPQLDKFAKKIRSNASMVLSIITVACKDKLPDVKKYMQEHQYEFQVALESNAITKHFEVREYPSKYLVSPRGKFIEIPPNTDWEAFVNRYVGLYKIEQ
jgi:thiol-disulfide isomerase/thioredoxin